jgi:hypothetical protein
METIAFWILAYLIAGALIAMPLTRAVKLNRRRAGIGAHVPLLSPSELFCVIAALWVPAVILVLACAMLDACLNAYWRVCLWRMCRSRDHQERRESWNM